MRAAAWIAAVLLAANCTGGDETVIFNDRPAIARIAIVNQDYVVLRPVSTVAAPGASSAKVYEDTVYFQPSDRILDLRHLDLRTAKVDQHGGRSVVLLYTTNDGDRLLHDWTSAHINERLGIFVDGKLTSAPVIKTPINDMIVIDGDFTKAQAETIVSRLQKGGTP